MLTPWTTFPCLLRLLRCFVNLSTVSVSLFLFLLSLAAHTQTNNQFYSVLFHCLSFTLWLNLLFSSPLFRNLYLSNYLFFLSLYGFHSVCSSLLFVFSTILSNMYSLNIQSTQGAVQLNTIRLYQHCARLNECAWVRPMCERRFLLNVTRCIVYVPNVYTVQR